LHSAATCQNGLISSWGDVEYRNFFALHELDLTSSTWLTDGVGAMGIIHGGWSADADDYLPSPQPASVAPTATPGLSCWAADLSGDAGVMLTAYDDSEDFPLTLRTARRALGRTGPGGSLETYDPLHLRYVPEAGYVCGYGGTGKPLLISDDGEQWAELLSPSEGKRCWPWGRNRVVCVFNSGNVWWTQRTPLRSRRAAQISPGGYNTIRVASHSDNAPSAIVAFAPDAGCTMTRIKLVSGVWRAAETLNGWTVDEALPANLTPHEPPPGMDPAADSTYLLVHAESYNVGARRLFVGNPGQGCMVTQIYQLSDNSPAWLLYPFSGGGQSGDQLRLKTTDHRRWIKQSSSHSTTPSGSLELVVKCGGASGQAMDVDAIIAVEGWRTVGAMRQPRYWMPPGLIGTLRPDEQLSVPASIDLASFAARLVWSIPNDFTAAPLATYQLAWLWADANNFVRFALDNTSNTATAITATVVVGGSTVGTVSVSGFAFQDDTIDVCLSIDGTAVTMGGRVGRAAWSSDSDTLSGAPTATATAVRYYPPSGECSTQEVVAVAIGDVLDATDPDEAATLAVSDTPAFTTDPTCSITGSSLTFTAGVAESQVGGGISYSVDLIKSGLTIAEGVTSPVNLADYGPGRYRVRSTATDDTAHDDTAQAVSSSTDFAGVGRRRARRLLMGA
jgi:hypothetical protein